MTDKEQIEKIYKKIQAKYSHVTDKEEIDNLAIKWDKRNTLLMSLAYFLGAIVCGIIFVLLLGNETYEMTRYLFLVMTGSGIFECFKTLGKYSKIEQKYRPVIRVKYEGKLTKDRILQDGGKILKKAEYIFNIIKLPLYDKEDEIDVGIDNDAHHKYYLYFKLPENNLQMTYKVKRDRYMDAVIGAEYFVVVTPANEIATIYQATNWSVDSALQECFNETLSANSVHQANEVQTDIEPEKTKKLLPILSIVLVVFSYFIPILIGVPMGLVALVLAIVGLVKQRTRLSVSAIIVTVILFILLIISVAVTIARAI